MKLSIVIPNYNGEQLLQKNLPRVMEVCPGAEIIVVDDASGDGSIAMLGKQFPTIQVIARKTNRGFSATVNTGVAAAAYELVMLLNSDAYPQKGCIDSVLTHFKNPEVFAVGLAQKCIEGDKTVIRGRGLGRFHQGFLIHSFAAPNARSTLWVSGGAGVFRKQIWQKLGGMQKLYNPFYWEDIDLSYRAMKAGYNIVFEPDAGVIHQQSVGSIQSSFSKRQIRNIAYRNQFFFVWLNISDADYLLQQLIWLPIHILKAFVSGDWAFVQGLLCALLQLPRILKERSGNKKYWVRSDKEVLSSI